MRLVKAALLLCLVGLSAAVWAENHRSSAPLMLADGIAIVGVSDVERESGDIIATVKVGDAKQSTEMVLRFRHRAARAFARLLSESKEADFGPEEYIRRYEPNANEIRREQIRNGINVENPGQYLNRRVREIRSEPPENDQVKK